MLSELWLTLTAEWWGILIICAVGLAFLLLISALLYKVFFKRFYDMLLSGIAILVLSPILLLLIILGAIIMKGNPFFTQLRPGKKEKIFRLIKFRTMTCEKDENGELLPDEKRLTGYGKFLRKTSLDELPELINIFVGHMSIVGPRPLLVQYLPLYNEEQKHRHDVRPGLTGYAQANGRNALSWEERFKMDVHYVNNVSLFGDVKIIIQTVFSVLKRSGISSETSATMEVFTGTSKPQVKILFTCVGRRVELMQAYRLAADKADVDLKIYATDMTNTAPAAQFVDKVFIAPRIKSPEYLPFLLDVCEKENIDALIPTIDTDLMLLAENREAFIKVGTKVLIANPEKVAVCRDKNLTGDYFNSIGLSAPKSFNDASSYDMGFPAFIKPKDGSSSIDAYKVNNEEELKAYADKITDYVVQPFISGTEYTVDMFCDLDGNPVYITPRIRLAVRAGEVLKTKINNEPSIVEEMKTLASDFKPRGAITVQLIRDDNTGKNWYIEINPRYGGGAPLSIKAGADSPSVVLGLLTGKTFDYQQNAAEEGAVYSRFDQSVRVE